MLKSKLARVIVGIPVAILAILVVAFVVSEINMTPQERLERDARIIERRQGEEALKYMREGAS